jgi:hypothetical protein
VVKVICSCVLMLVFREAAVSQATPVAANAGGGPAELPQPVKAVFDYLSMAGTSTAPDFVPLSQSEQTTIYLKSLINPVWYVKGGLSAALDMKNDKPREWEQGASGYGKRFGNIMGQYAIQRTVTFGVSSILHEDNRYFGSGKSGFWGRTGYALSSSFLARHDNGKRYPSLSLIGGFAVGAFVSRSWQPPSTRSAGDGAVSFGTSMGYNVLTCGVKEFLPDIVRPIINRHK